MTQATSSHPRVTSPDESLRERFTTSWERIEQARRRFFTIAAHARANLRLGA